MDIIVLSDEELKIYNKIIENRDVYGINSNRYDNVFISNKFVSGFRDETTNIEKLTEFFNNSYSLDVDRKLLESFIQNNSKKQSLDKNTKFKYNFYWSEDNKNYLSKKDDFDVFLSFSRIGFNECHTRAFLYTSHFFGPLSAMGGYTLLDKVNEKWNVKEFIERWVS